MNPEKLQCLTTACWLRGYADTLGEFTHGTLIHRMNQAATLLEKTWIEYDPGNVIGKKASAAIYKAERTTT